MSGGSPSVSNLDDARERWMANRMRETMAAGATEGMADGPVKLEDESYDAKVAENERLIVDCWAVWCGPCQAIAPVIEQMAQDYKGKVLFGKLNVDENPATARRLAIMGIPTLLFYRDGKLVDRIVGAAPRDRIEQKMKEVFELN